MAKLDSAQCGSSGGGRSSAGCDLSTGRYPPLYSISTKLRIVRTYFRTVRFAKLPSVGSH